MNTSMHSMQKHRAPWNRLHRLLFLVLFTMTPILEESTQATTIVAPGFEQMVGNAEQIFTARVGATRSRWAVRNGHRCIITSVNFDVEQMIKGTAGKQVELEFLGGTVGNDTMEIMGVPTFRAGERVLLFSENNGKQFCPLVGIHHGKLVIERNSQTGTDVVLRHNRQSIRSASEVGADAAPQLSAAAGQATAEGSLALKEFVTAVKQELAKGGRR